MAPPEGHASTGTGFPAPGAKLHATFVNWMAGRRIHRIHDARFKSIQLNASGKGDARFSPILDAKAKTIPTLYAGTTFECTAMETVFHAIPHSSGFKTFDKDKLAGKRASIISPARDLSLVDLSSTALRKLGIPRLQLIDSDATDYPNTRPWAIALHAQFPKADGLVWVSRQDDEARALVLFGHRIGKADLVEISAPMDVAGHPDLYAQLLDLAHRIGMNVI